MVEMMGAQPQAVEPTSLFDLGCQTGTNESERLLLALCRQSFLRLWAHANVFTDEGFKDGKGSAKELCDALVVFGKDVLIFSDKHVAFQSDKPLEVAWPRWYRRAVTESIRQLHGAKNWLTRFPARAFLDARCERPVPVSVPAAPDVRFHLIAVTRGSRQAVLSHSVGQGLGSFRVDTRVRGDGHLEAPFTLGIPSPGKTFVHVFDEVTIELLVKELDTAADFIHYLCEREAVFGKNGLTLLANGEEDLLAAYLRTMDVTGEHHQLVPPNAGEEGPTAVIFDETYYEGLRRAPDYLRKKEADRVSYLWDELIERFIVLGDPTLRPPGFSQEPCDTEQALRYLAAESRFERRSLARALLGALQRVQPNQRLGRVVGGRPATAPVYVLLVVPKRSDESYDEYRQNRLALLHAYCRIAKLQAMEGSVFIGIGLDNPHKSDKGGSEDLFVWTQDTWTDENFAELARMRDELKILRTSNMEISEFHDDEFPVAVQPSTTAASPARS